MESKELVEDNDIKKSGGENNGQVKYEDTFEHRDIKVVTEFEYEQKARMEIGFKLTIFKLIAIFCFSISVVAIVAILLFFINDPYETDKFFSGDESALAQGRKILLVSLMIIQVLSALVFAFFRLYPKYLIDKKVVDLKRTKSTVKGSRKKITENKFEILSNINIEHLNKYYKQTYDHCDKSFSIAKMASNASYAILVAGLVLFFISTMFLKEEQSRLIMFGITTGGGVVIKIVSSLYVYMYNKSVSKLSEYHDKLYAIQNVLISLELSNQISDPVKKDDIKADMIKSLLENHNKEIEDIKKLSKC